MIYKAIIFDMDGTLVHTVPEFRYRLLDKVFSELGVKCSDKFCIDRFWFEARRDEIIKDYFSLDPDVFWQEYRNHDTLKLRKPYTKVYDDVDFINELRQNNYKIGIVTGAPQYILDFDLELLGKENFDAVVRAQLSNGIRPKPDPHGLKECMDILKVDKKNVMFVGNADEDVLTAKNAGVYDVLIDRNEHIFPDIKPSLTINSLYDLRRLLKLK